MPVTAEGTAFEEDVTNPTIILFCANKIYGLIRAESKSLSIGV